MSSFRIDEKTIQNAFPSNITFDRLALEYLRETFDNILKKIDDSKIYNRADMDNFISKNFYDNGRLKLHINNFLNAGNPTDVNQFKSLLISAILSWFFVNDIRNTTIRNIDLNTLLQEITKDKVLFYGISQYMPPSAINPFRSFPPTNNTFSIDTMRSVIDNFNKNRPWGKYPVNYNYQGLDLLNNILKTVVYAVKEYAKVDPDLANRVSKELPVALPDQGATPEHNLTSKIFTLIIDALSSRNKGLTETDLEEILPTLPGYPYISLFLIYPMKV